MENSMNGVSQKGKNETIVSSSNSTPGYLSKKIPKKHSLEKIYTPLYSLQPCLLQPRILAIEYYSAIRKKEILSFVTTWMDPEGIMLSEVSQGKKNTAWFHLYMKNKRQRKWTTKRKQKKTHREQTGNWQRGGEWGKERAGCRGLKYKLLTAK